MSRKWLKAWAGTLRAGEKMRSVSGHSERQEGDNSCCVLTLLFISSGLSPMQTIKGGSLLIHSISFILTV